MNYSSVSNSKWSSLLNILVAGLFLAGILWLTGRLIYDGLYPLGLAFAAVGLFVALVYLRRRFSPFQWMGIAIVLITLFIVFPILFTIYLSFTNMGSGHLLSKNQAIGRLENQQYLPEGGITYNWAAYESPEGEYALWIVPPEGKGMLAKPEQALSEVIPGEAGVGALDDAGFPTEIEGYTRLDVKDIVPIIDRLGEIVFGDPPNTVRITSLREAAALQALYVYDSDQDVIINQQTGESYEPVEGTFTSAAGEELIPGYIVSIGQDNFVKFLGNPGFREPLFKMFGWNITFAVLSVAFSFAVGLIVTLMFDDLPGRAFIRALLIIPWPIPVLVSVLIWRSMLNPDLGFIAPLLESIFGSSPAWFQDPFWTRFALVMVNVWLSYPYFYVITAGALRSISSEIMDAAVVDGAGPFKKMYFITLPLLLRILTPLLIASFTFNFNNFVLIYIFNFGLPPRPDTIVPMGYTDILISFVYRLAFITTNVTDYGLAAAITILLFIFVGMMVLIQLRVSKSFDEEAI